MWDKLKREWKTFLLGLLTVLVGAHDAIIAAGYGPTDFDPIIPDRYKAYAPLAIGLLFLGLRKWKDYVSNN